VKVINDAFVPPQWVMIAAICIVLTWGFSKRTEEKSTLVVEIEKEKETKLGIRS
jgi:hypothetical protein